MSNQSTKSDDMNDDGMLNAETQRKLPQGKILQPKLRFKGFADPWQQRKLGELAEFSKGAGFSKSDLCEHGRGIILYGQMYTNYQLVIDCISTHVPMNSHGVESRRNDIIVPASGETPEDIATASVVKLDGVLLGGDINVVRLHGNQTDATFIALLLSHGSLHKTLASRAQGKSIVHLHISDIANLHVLKPGITEQSRIAEFFRVLDDLIAAAKKKADLLKLKKRYYLQAIFSQHLRFKGFTKPWQQRKLGDVCKVSKNINKTQYSQSDVLSVSRDAGVVNQVQYQGRSFASNDLSRYRIVTPQSLIYTKSPLKVAPYGIMISSHVHGIVSPLYAVYQCPNNYNHFLSYFFSSSATLNNYLKPLVAKGAKNTINVSDCDAANGMVPYVNAEEVDAIVFIFQILDALIEEVKDKHDLICRKKAFFLQKMFV